MQGEQQPKMNKKVTGHRRKSTEPSEFDSQITLELDEFFRYFNCYYPGKNKEQIISKCISGNTYWITLDSQYYSEEIDFEIGKIKELRKKSALKNGVYPPTKDCLEEEKFILMVRKLIAEKYGTLNLQDIRSTPIQTVIQFLQHNLYLHQSTMDQELNHIHSRLHQNNQQIQQELRVLGIPFVKAARLFAYQILQKEVINQLVEKAIQKEAQPRCDFCLTRDKQIVKCNICNLYAHPLCFGKVPKNGEEFVCDQCSRCIPEDAQCELCPLLGGHFLQLADEGPLFSYHFEKGQNNLKFKITRETHPGIQRLFIHISCFVLHSDCTYNIEKGKVQGIHHIDRNKKNPSICLICGNMIGLTVSCVHEGCRRAYHPECAKRNNLKINVIKANNKALLEIYCERHKKPESYQYLKESVGNRVKELKKFYQSLDYEIKRYGISHHSLNRLKKSSKLEDNIKLDICLKCSVENNFETEICNCKKCYGWYHVSCATVCPFCDM